MASVKFVEQSQSPQLARDRSRGGARLRRASFYTRWLIDKAGEGYAVLNEIRELSALRIALSVLCLCSAISIAAFSSGAV